MNIKVKAIVVNGGYSVKANGSVNITFIAGYSELANMIQVQQLLNNDVSIKARVPRLEGGADIFKLGVFRVQQTVIDHDGETKLKFNGFADFVEMDNLYKLPGSHDEVSEFNILLEADV